ncbi:MAG: lysophospholipid acyltransferase family protein [Caldilineaceae bacterium]|nr:lysophospholipid acyltransferase family protein [Caldilineaceae bacterium]
MQTLSRFALKLLGWRVEANLPATSKYVIVGAFHTTNWDFVFALLITWAMGIRIHWVGKDSLFRGPMDWVMRRLGGIPVDRRSRHNYVQQMVDIFAARDGLILTITPEGTRGKTPYWRTGFYYVALGAHVPIALGYIDYKRRIGGIGGSFMPSGDIQADMEIIRAFFADKTPKYPEKAGAIRLRPTAEAPEQGHGVGAT